MIIRTILAGLLVIVARMVTTGPTRQDTYSINVNIAGHDLGVWDKMSGGEVDSDETRYYPGGMEPPVSLGGRKTVGNVTVSRLYRLQRDHVLLASNMINWAGRAKVVIQKQPLDIDGNHDAAVKPIIYNGTLKRVTFPEVDSESSNAGLVEIEVTVDGYPTSH